MTSRTTGAFQLRNRLSKTLTSVAVAATGLVAGATMLSGGEAKAFNCTFGTGATCAPNVWYDSNPVPTDKQILFKQLPTAGSGDIEFKWVDINSNGTWIGPTDWKVDQWHVDVDFNPDLLAADGLSTFDYILKITTPPGVFYDVSLSSAISPPPPSGGTVTKQVFTVNQVNPLDPSTWTKGSPITSLLTNSGIDDLSGTLIWVTDTAQANAGGSVDMYQNSFRQDVPGPLPILGAGAAFGYTRRLRRRLKATRLA